VTSVAREHGLGYEPVTLLAKVDVMNLQDDEHFKKYERVTSVYYMELWNKAYNILEIKITLGRNNRLSFDTTWPA
jgi:hypothetical protein